MTNKTIEGADSLKVDYNIKRIRVFPSHPKDRTRGTVLAMNPEAADKLARSRPLREFLAAQDRFFNILEEEHHIEGTHSEVQAEIRPPLTPELIAQLGEKCVDGTFVPDWHPDDINPRLEGVVVSEFAHTWPESPIDSGTHVIASSLLVQRRRDPNTNFIDG